MVTEKEFFVNIAYLKAYKHEHNLTNRELAKRIGVHESSISRILRKEKGIGMKFIAGVIYNASELDLDKLLKVNHKEVV